MPIEKKPVPEMKPQPQQEVINLDDDDEIQFE